MLETLGKKLHCKRKPRAKLFDESQPGICRDLHHDESCQQNSSLLPLKKATKGVQVIVDTKTMSTITLPHTAEKAVATSHPKRKQLVEKCTGICSDSTNGSSGSSSPQLSSTSSLSNGARLKTSKEELEISKLENNSRFFLGLPEDCFYIVNVLVEEGGLDYIDVLITMKKIRTNDQFVVVMAPLMTQLIVWPPSWKIKKLVPNQFKAYYNNVQSIIDCFEVEIEKPSNALHQAKTWSEYKKCNTIKYLVSCTPNGLINFISSGFGGRTTDVQIVEKSDFINVIPENCIIMADRGFKHIETILHKKSASLLRPPSISAKQKLTKAEVNKTKIIAALRVHIERLIRRLREFAMLKPHACIRSRIVHLLDHAVIIVCGLVNLQERLIKK
ncbi:unnamed protein product [Acanthoscelides obtectus]|uniref:DDE Tnp4 domain-containing protein n=1 Tax=Acanthoscelides obtectus TaxID=200917 RepID=A0A9P0M6R0_ACAOB|nr:unnamed protein product [Acanthoscelides obtectus]CAK1624211.1 hypothetical protein AOBTE_LOCUS2406 [Acanthoscelides obtectus]